MNGEAIKIYALDVRLKKFHHKPTYECKEEMAQGLAGLVEERLSTDAVLDWMNTKGWIACDRCMAPAKEAAPPADDEGGAHALA